MKKIALLISVIVLSTILTACGNKENENKNNNKTNIIVESNEKNEDKKEENTKPAEDKVEEDDEENIINNEVRSYFIKNKEYIVSLKSESVYRGYAEAGFAFRNPKIDNENLIVTYDGQMLDGYGEDERGPRTFKVEYTFKADEAGEPMAYERIRNSDYMAENKDTLYSIIKNYIFIWGDVKNGASWEQAVDFKGTKYRAKTVMSEVTEKGYKLTTTIKNIKGFNNNTYSEVRTYEKGKGLTSFLGSPYFNEGVDSDMLIGYALNP